MNDRVRGMNSGFSQAGADVVRYDEKARSELMRRLAAIQLQQDQMRRLQSMYSVKRALLGGGSEFLGAYPFQLGSGSMPVGMAEVMAEGQLRALMEAYARSMVPTSASTPGRPNIPAPMMPRY